MSAGFDFFAIARAARDSQDLSSIDKLVFVVGLMMNRNAATGACFPSYPTIKHSCSLKDDRTVALAISHLETAGFLSRKKERGKSTRYEFHVPASEVPALNAPTSNAPTPNAGRVPASDVGGVPASDVGLNNKVNNKVNNKERESRERAPAKPTRTADANTPTPTPKRLSQPEGIPAEAWSDWMQVRGNAPVTKSFWKDFCNNADRLHLTPAKAVELCAQRGWKRLDADWESVKVAESNEDRLLRLMGEA